MEQVNSFSGDFAFLSNFWERPVKVDTLTFASVEHAYQAAKCDDYTDVQKFLNPNLSCAGAKRLGRKVRLRHDWERIKDEVMLKCVRAKFKDEFLAKLLLNTGDAELVEGNWWGDRYWGVCKGEGQNKLGKILMLVRKELRNES